MAPVQQKQQLSVCVPSATQWPHEDLHMPLLPSPINVGDTDKPVVCARVRVCVCALPACAALLLCLFAPSLLRVLRCFQSLLFAPSASPKALLLAPPSNSRSCASSHASCLGESARFSS